MTDMVAIYSINFLKIFFSGTNGHMALRIDIWHQVYEQYQECSNSDLRLVLTFFYGKVKYGKLLEHRISWKVLPKNVQMMTFG